MFSIRPRFVRGNLVKGYEGGDGRVRPRAFRVPPRRQERSKAPAVNVGVLAVIDQLAPAVFQPDERHPRSFMQGDEGLPAADLAHDGRIPGHHGGIGVHLHPVGRGRGRVDRLGVLNAGTADVARFAVVAHVRPGRLAPVHVEPFPCGDLPHRGGILIHFSADVARHPGHARIGGRVVLRPCADKGNGKNAAQRQTQRQYPLH